MDSAVARRFVCFCGLSAATLLLGACATEPPLAATRNQIIISVRDQKLTVVKEDHTRVSFPISTSKFGLGDRRGTYETPTGELAVAAKIGAGAPVGSVFHGRVRTGEIVKVDAPGRDAIVTRILALRGLEANNQQAMSRGIYIHGTPEERNIGRPTSYGCIRMRSRDVVTLFDMVRVGARVQVIDTTQSQAIAANILRPAAPGPNLPVPPNTPAAAAMGSTPLATTATTAPTEAPAASQPDAGQTHVVKSITTTGAGNAVKTTTTSVAAVGGAATPATTTTTTTARPVTPPPAGATAVNKKQQWNGAPAKLLADQNAAEARARQHDARPPVGAPTPTQPVSNNKPANNNSSAAMQRSALDSL